MVPKQVPRSWGTRLELRQLRKVKASDVWSTNRIATISSGACPDLGVGMCGLKIVRHETMCAAPAILISICLRLESQIATNKPGAARQRCSERLAASERSDERPLLRTFPSSWPWSKPFTPYTRPSAHAETETNIRARLVLSSFTASRQ